MTTQNQINLCIDHLNKIGEGVSRVEISNCKNISPRLDSRDARVFSAKNPTVYYTIYSIYTDEEIETMEEQAYEEFIADGERVAAEIAEDIENNS